MSEAAILWLEVRLYRSQTSSQKTGHLNHSTSTLKKKIVKHSVHITKIRNQVTETSMMNRQKSAYVNRKRHSRWSRAPKLPSVDWTIYLFLKVRLMKPDKQWPCHETAAVRFLTIVSLHDLNKPPSKRPPSKRPPSKRTPSKRTNNIKSCYVVCAYRSSMDVRRKQYSIQICLPTFIISGMED
jgi:hypothetical protein